MLGRSVADVLIEVNGVPLVPAVRRDLISVSVRDDLGMASTFSLVLHSWDADYRRVTWADEGFFALGNTLSIAMGYVDGPLMLVISGDIADLEAEFDAERTPTLTVTGYDFRQRLARSKNYMTYQGDTDSTIAQRVIARHRLPHVVVPTSDLIPYVTQDDESDLAFLQQRAKLNGYEVLMVGPAVYFGPAPVSTTPVLSLGAELLSFSPRVTASSLIDRVEVIVQQDNAEEQRAQAKVKHFPGTMPLDRLDRLDARPERLSATEDDVNLAKKLARSKLRELTAQSLSASGRCRGNALLRAGQLVAIDGVGRRFSGPYRLTSVHHAFSPDAGFTTNFQVAGVV